ELAPLEEASPPSRRLDPPRSAAPAPHPIAAVDEPQRTTLPMPANPVPRSVLPFVPVEQASAAESTDMRERATMLPTGVDSSEVSHVAVRRADLAEIPREAIEEALAGKALETAPSPPPAAPSLLETSYVRAPAVTRPHSSATTGWIALGAVF